MLFTSRSFVVFLAAVLVVHRLLPPRWRNPFLLAASYVFYAGWDWRFVGLLVVSTTCDWLLARAISREPTRAGAKRWVACSVAINLAFLGFFKYFDFLIGSTFDFYLGIVLPVGISFYTFQSISYIVDVYRGEIEPAKNPIDFALFVAFFPHMVAGPIMKSRDLLPQFQRPRRATFLHVRAGLWLVLFGFFKKLVIGDNLAAVVDQVFAQSAPSGAAVLLGVYAFAFQIYCDFSGYTDIARGVAKFFGVELMLNFDRPYLARNPSDFWRRWHISLSQWLREYLYVPLGGNRLGRLVTYRNMMITMVLGGLWHGAAWNFVLWGAYHGALLVVHRALVVDRGRGPRGSVVGSVVSRIVMFHAVCYGWLLFRARSVEQIRAFTAALGAGLGTLADELQRPAMLVAVAVLVLWTLEAWLRNADDPTTRPGWRLGLGPLTCAVLVIAIVVFTPPVTQTFIYFQF
jgi:alginate O-acetyltransferase complex protein AlgI